MEDLVLVIMETQYMEAKSMEAKCMEAQYMEGQVTMEALVLVIMET